MRTIKSKDIESCPRDHSLTEFISMSSHQLRNSLTIMHWYSEALLSGAAGELNDQQKRYLQTVYTAGQRLVQLVNDFLDVSRIESANLIGEAEPTDLQRIAADVLL